MQQRISIILPTYNEKDNILKMIAKIFSSVNEPVEIIVVDDNSPDGTAEIVQWLNDPRVTVIIRKSIRGFASALNRGIIEASGEYIGWFDADMFSSPERLPEMIEKMGEYDVVIGSRYVSGGKDKRAFFRRISSRLVNYCATLLLGYGIKDYDSGFVLLKRKVFDEVTIYPSGYGEYFIELIFDCCRRGFHVCEIPYVLSERDCGESKCAASKIMFFVTGFFYGLRILKTRFKSRRN